MLKSKTSFLPSESDPSLKPSDRSTKSLAFQKITDSAQIQFPNQDTYFVYRPAKANANIFEQFLAFLSLMYYKYLLHSGIYVMNKSERRVVNTIVLVSVGLSAYQCFLLLGAVLGIEI